MAMPYDERTVRELMESAEITPMGIQLEVNAEIFTVIHNLLAGMRDAAEISPDDDATLYNLWRKTVREMSRVELRAGYGIPMDEQIAMLRQAFAIESKYIPDQVFRPITGVKLTKKLIEKESAFDEDEMRLLFENKVWPSIAVNKTGDLERPTAYIVAGQPGSGKTRMSSVIIEEYNADIIQSMGDNFRGFHPHYQELLRKYGQYCALFSLPQAKFLSDLTLHRAAEGRYNLIQEGALENVQQTMRTIEYLKSRGYSVIIVLRACPRKKAGRPSISSSCSSGSKRPACPGSSRKSTTTRRACPSSPRRTISSNRTSWTGSSSRARRACSTTATISPRNGWRISSPSA